MSVTDVAARIQQIQAQLAQLTPTTSASDGTAFASALSDASAVSSDASTSDTSAGQAVVTEAKKYLGVPYVWGGTDPTKGLDCSGLVQLVYKKFGIDLPRVSYEQAKAGTPVASLDQAKPGDILAFGSPVHHVAIYIGDHKMVEAPRPGKDVRVSDVYETPTAIRRVLPDSAVTTTGTSSAGGVSAGTPYASVFDSAAAKYGVSASLLAAVAHQESGYNASAVSGAGAKGLMQLMPGTAKGLGVDPMNPTQAVDGAARMLKGLISEFGRVDYALAAYNAGPGAVHRYHGIPPYAETQRYVPAVLAYQKKLAA
jgi:hypothetical protein